MTWKCGPDYHKFTGRVMQFFWMIVAILAAPIPKARYYKSGFSEINCPVFGNLRKKKPLAGAKGVSVPNFASGSFMAFWTV
jgi:hypothetical protein